MPDPFLILLAVCAATFLATAGYLISQGGVVAALFAKRRREADPGDVVADPRMSRRPAARGRVKLALALHAISLMGLIFTTVVASGVMQAGRPGTEALPPEMNPLPQAE